MYLLRPKALTPARRSFTSSQFFVPRLQITPRRRRQLICATSTVPLDVVAFTLIVDDLVYWDGSTLMGQLGGGGAQTLFGFQALHSGGARAGLAAGVGQDVPESCLAWLEMNNIDISGLIVHPGAPTPRAWQNLEEDGRRHEVRGLCLWET